MPGFPGVTGLSSRQQLLALACRDDVEARLVERNGGNWSLFHGPFQGRTFKRRDRGPWTVLVQGVNLMLPEADRLIREFDFIPQARLDDLMVSYAADGGGVGPHLDHYDVFLLQGMGQRRWKISAPPRAPTLLEGVPLKILKNFRPSQEWLLEPGDLLYLPPLWAHDGTAEGECLTYSVGFRASPAQDLAEQFLVYLQDQLRIPGRYQDPDLRVQKHPAEIGSAMIDQVTEMLAKIRWNRDTVRDFLGHTLTEPKPQVYFDPPQAPVSLRQFARRCRERGLRLDPKTQLLFAATRFYINGEHCQVAQSDRGLLRRLADRRELDVATCLSGTALELLYDWYCCGFLALL
jgi:50S ribosomal protein L16 3-hydroxylase